MTKSLKLWKVLGATFLSVGAISISAAAVSHNLSSKSAEVKATGKDSYWSSWISSNSSTISTGGSSFMAALKTKIGSNTTTVSYDNLWSAYKTTDPVPGTNGSYIWDTYAGIKYSYQSNGSSVNTGSVGGGYNREHSVPKSWFGSPSSGAAYSDLFHLMPTDGCVNNARSNYAFGEVSSGTTYSFTAQTDGNGATYQTAGASKLGTPKAINDVSIGASYTTVFEPDDQYKGDFARNYMYFITRYYGTSYSPTTSGQAGLAIFSTSYPYMTSYGLALMQKWHVQDPVSTKETNRNDAVEALQGNRNPYIDYPEWADKIFGTSYGGGSSSSSDPSATISGTTSVTVGNTTTLTASLSNVTSTSNITWESSNTSVATVAKGTTSTSSSVATVTGIAAGSATISCKHSGTTLASKTVTVTSSGGGSGTSGTYSITFSTSGSDSSTALDTSGLLNLASSNTLVSSFTNATKCYAGTSGVKFGSSSATGSFTATPVSDAQSNVSSITIKSTKYGSDTGTLTLSVNGSSVKTGITPGTDNTYTPSSPISVSSFGIATSAKRAYVGEVSFVVGSSSSSDPSATITGTTSVQVGNTTTLTAALSNVTSTSNITWESSDTSVATVSKGTTSTSSSVATVTGVAAGSATISCKHSGTTLASKTVTVTASATLSSISVSTAPTKTTYTAGEYFDPTGLVITRTYSNSTSDTYTYANHTSEFSFSPTTSTALTTANTSVTITYNSKTCSQAITVNSSSGGGDTKTDILFAKGFGGYTTNSFSAGGTDYTGVANSTNSSGSTYAMQVFNGSSGAVRGNQSSASSNFSVRNTTTYNDYYISSVSLTVSGGTLDGSTSGRSVVYFGSSAYSSPSSSSPTGSATTASPASSGQTTLTWTNSTNTNCYFILYNLKTSGAALLADASTALTVTWTPKSSGSSSPTLTGITIDTSSVQKSFSVGDTFNYTGLSVTANYSDSSYDEVVTSGYTVTTPDMSTAGTKTVTVSYNGKSASYEIAVTSATTTENDVINLTSTGVESGSTTYVTWSQNVTSTGASYVGNSAGANASVQLRSNNNSSGIVQTASGGHVNKVTVSWNSATQANRVLNIYGKSSAYSAPSDLYTTSTQGTLIGTITYGTSTTLEISSIYSFIGIRSNSGAIYLDSITVEYKTAEWWAENFLNKVTCNNGVTPPSSSNWIATNTDYYAKLPTSEQNIIKATVGNQGGTTLEQAMARYIEVLSKYSNRTNYPDYIFNPSSANQMNRVNNGSSSATIILLTVGILSSFAGFAFVGYWLKKKREY